MNCIAGIITDILTEGHLSLVSVTKGGLVIQSIVIDTPEQNPLLATGRHIQILFKETETMIAKEMQGALSVRNRIPCLIESLETGKLLSQVKMRWQDAEIVSIITARASREMGLRPGDEVLALDKTSEVSLGWEHETR